MTAAIDPDAWDGLVDTSDPGSYLQTTGWARVKAENGQTLNCDSGKLEWKARP